MHLIVGVFAPLLFKYFFQVCLSNACQEEFLGASLDLN